MGHEILNVPPYLGDPAVLVGVTNADEAEIEGELIGGVEDERDVPQDIVSIVTESRTTRQTIPFIIYTSF